MKEKLMPHIDHRVECTQYDGWPVIECLDCNEVLVNSEDDNDSHE